MLGWLLNLVYALLLIALSPVLLWTAYRSGKYRQGWSQKLLGRVPRIERDGRRQVWFHAVSVGEVKQLGTLLNEIDRRGLNWNCVVSTTTRTGHDLARALFADRTVFYCPLDFTWAVNNAMRRIEPDLLVLTELELWPNLIGGAKRRGAGVAVVNGRLGEKSYRGYRRVRRLLVPVLRRIDLFGVQAAEYGDRFEKLGIEPRTIQVTGSIKYDGVETNRNNETSRALRELAGFAPDEPIVMAGSTDRGEEAAVLSAWNQLREAWPDLQLILVPRHPERFEEVARLLTNEGHPYHRRSQLPRSPSPPVPQSPGPPVPDNPPVPRSQILLVDTIGELSHWWALATVAFVGGSLDSDRGGQNMIEPAAYGAAVCFGPNTWNFRHVVEQLLARDAARVVHSSEELAEFVGECLTDPVAAAARGERAAALVRESQGATSKTIDALAAILEVEPATIRPAA